MSRWLAALLAVVTLAAAGPAFAQDRTFKDGPDFSDLPVGALSKARLTRSDKQALAELRNLDPDLASKIEKNLKGKPSIRGRFVYLVKQIQKLDERVNIAELNHKKGFSDKKLVSSNVKLRSRLAVFVDEYGHWYFRFLEAQDRSGATKHAPAFEKRLRRYINAYQKFQAERRRTLGLHSEIGKTEPATKKAADKPKKHGAEKTKKTGKSKKTKKVCNGGGLSGEMNCVEVRIHHDG